MERRRSVVLTSPEPLPPAAADCAAGLRLNKSDEKDSMITNRPARSTYPKENSVITSGATPPREGLLHVVFFLSGASALTYQVAWQRLLFGAFGVDVESITII